jgi:hypothetical protein
MNILRYLLSPKLFVPALGVAVAAVIAYGSFVHTEVQAASVNDVIYGGVKNATDFQTKYKANTKGDLDNIYNSSIFGGMSPSEISRFVKTAKWGTAYKDGRLVLDDGRVVATKGKSLGRTKLGGANPYTIKIDGVTYYWGYNSTAFGSNSLRALVMMDANNKYMEFAVLSVCGNPITGERPKFQCEMLNKTQKNDNTWEFWTTVSLKNATVKKLVYNFGDGTTATKTNPNEKVPHTFKPGTWNITVTVTYTVNGKEQTETIQVKCKTQVTVKEEEKPVFVCKSLTFKAITRTRFEFVAKGESDKATFKTAKFDFGDGNTAEGVQANVAGQPETVKVEHEYAKEGKYTIKAFLTYDKGTTKETKECVVEVTVKPKTCEDTPNKPECLPPKPPETPKILPATGPLETLVSALGIGTITGAGLYYVGTRRSLIDTILKR